MSWKKHVLGDIVKRKRRSLKIDPEKEYKLVTIKLYHKGVILRTIAKGSTIKSSMSFVKTGDFILSGIDARNGAFGIVPEELDGAVITNDFWYIEPDEAKISKEFFLYLTTTSFFDYLCKQSSDGTTQRIRLQKDRFFNFSIQLPEIDEQQKILEKLNFISNANYNINNQLTHQLDLIKQLRQSFLREAMQGKLVTSVRSSGVETQQTGQQLLAKIKAEKAQLIAKKKLKKEKPLPVITAEEIPFEIPENVVWCRLGEYFNVDKGLVGIQKAIAGHIPLVVTSEQRLTHNEIHFEGKAVIVPTVSSTGHGHASLKRIHYQEGKFAVGNILACIMPIMPSYFNMKFIYNYLDTYKEFFFVEKMKGAANVSLKISSIKETPIPLLPIEIQNKYEHLIIDCEKLEQSIKESQGYNQMLLQQVLREALQPKEETKIITIATRKLPNPLKTILAAHIVNICNTRDFGRVKFQKILFLVEYFCKIDFESKYVKKAAGPYDYQLIQQIEQDFNRMNFFKVEQDKSDNHRVTYTPRSASSEINGFFVENFSDESVKINAFLMKMRPLSWSECEIVATIFAVWNNRLIKKELVTNELLYNDFMAWSPRKSDLAKDFHKKLFWMKEERIIPEGWGNYVDEPSL